MRGVGKLAAGWCLFLLLSVAILFFEPLTGAASPGWLRAVLIEIRAACRDLGTQWMVFACCAVYFVTFTVLLKRGTGSAKRGATCNVQPATFNLLGNADFWLCGLLLIAALHYAFNYDTASGSTQALMLMAGAAIGKGAHLWVSWGVLTTKLASQARFQMDSQGDKAASRHEVTNNTKGGTDNLQPATFNLQLLLATLLLLLAAASVWHPETAMQFQYRGLKRWSGPWDNPNIFGLLMGAGVVIGAGLLVARWSLKVAGSPGEERAHCQDQRKASPSPRLAGVEGPNGERAGVRCAFHHLGIWLWRVTLFAALACCAVGLLKSYSRGAWLGTALGLAVLAFRAVGQAFQPAGVSDFPVRRSERATGKSPEPADRNVRPTTQSGTLSCRSCISWLIKNRLPLAILLGSLLVICFWQFRYTEFHPVRRAFSVGNKADFSWRNRVAAWEGSLAMMADRPLTGFGWNKPERIYDQYYRQPKVSEGMAIQLNHYFILGMSLGLPALLCFAAYLGLTLTRSGERGTQSEVQPRNTRTTRNDEGQNSAAPNLQLATFNLQLHDVCHAAVVVLLVGLWFDGGLFNLATAVLFWVLVELGRGTALRGCRGDVDREQTVSCSPRVSRLFNLAVLAGFLLLLVTGLLCAKARDPFQREWFSVRTSSGEAVAAAVVMPDRGGPFPVVVWCHGSGGSLAGDGETLRQFASLGMAAVGIEYSKTNQAGFDAQFAAVLEDVANKPWAATRLRSGGIDSSTKHTNETKNGTRLQVPAVVEADRKSEIVNHKSPAAWIGNSLGAQRQLSFLARHPERQPVALVRLNGGMVEELREQSAKGNIEHSTLNLEPRTAEGTSADGGPTPNRKSSIINRKFVVWIAHGENDEIFPANDARAVAEWLRANGASVELDVYPGRGHGFGEDQPLLVRRAAEFCADNLGATMMVPDTVRTSRWYWWIPPLLAGVAICSGRFFFRRSSRCEKAPTMPESKWSGLTSAATRVIAGLALATSLLLSSAHLLLPRCQVSSVTTGLARQWCVRPELRNDFDWLTSQPWAAQKPIHVLLEHLNLAQLQRGPFAEGLSEAEWREYVLSPVISVSNADFGWRRNLWEFLAPRVRRETESHVAAQIVVRELRRRVVVKVGVADSIQVAWSRGTASPRDYPAILVAALRSVGIAARCNLDGSCELFSGQEWSRVHEPLSEIAKTEQWQ